MFFYYTHSHALIFCLTGLFTELLLIRLGLQKWPFTELLLIMLDLQK